jgi:hypothetical protein
MGVHVQVYKAHLCQQTNKNKHFALAAARVIRLPPTLTNGLHHCLELLKSLVQGHSDLGAEAEMSSFRPDLHPGVTRYLGCSMLSANELLVLTGPPSRVASVPSKACTGFHAMQTGSFVCV